MCCIFFFVLLLNVLYLFCNRFILFSSLFHSINFTQFYLLLYEKDNAIHDEIVKHERQT